MAKWLHTFVVAGGMFFVNLASAQTMVPGVAFLDTGTSAGGINLAGGQNFVGDPNDLSDQSYNSHGTYTSLIINQQLPGVPLYAYKISGNNEQSAATTDAGIVAAAAEAGVKVIAITNASEAASSFIGPAAAQNKFIAISIGNNDGGQPDPKAIAASQTLGVVLGGGSDEFGAALFNTSLCGIAAARCLRANGFTPLVDYFGSSFATANLAGIAAAVWQSAPWLTNEQLAQVMFATAIDLGAPGVDDVYGQGYIANAAQVINSPAGPVSVPSGGGGGGAGAALAVGALAVGVAVGTNVLGKNKKKLEKTLVLDPFGRPFTVDLTKLAYVRDTHKISIDNYLRNIDELYNSVDLKFGDNNAVNLSYSTFSDDRFDVGRHFAMAGDPAYSERALDWSANFVRKNSNGMNYKMGINIDPALNFGVMNSISARSPRSQPVTFISGQNFTTPYLGFNARADSAGMGYSSPKGWDLQFAVVNSDANSEYGPKSVAGVIEGSYQIGDRGKLSAQFGRLKEVGSLFGGSTGGIFGVEDTTTYAFSISGTWHISNTISAIGNYGLGYSSVNDAKASLFHDFSSVRSNWFGMGLIGRQLFRDHDQWGVAFSQPLRVIDGEVDMRVPYKRDVPGNIYSYTDRIGLNPTGREYTLETFYRLFVTPRASVGAHFMYQHQPNHDANASDEFTVLATLRYGF